MSDPYGQLQHAMEQLAKQAPERYANNPEALAEDAIQCLDDVGVALPERMDAAGLAQNVVDDVVPDWWKDNT